MSTSKKYRGFTVPTPEKDGNGWYILDETLGWFQSGQRATTILFWELAADRYVKDSLVAEGFIEELGDEQYHCLQCGAVVMNVFTHKKFHDKLDK